jgi:Zn-dependent peptidase ImmA (M78 family)/transcriptional regulator with XRE-family HTH domain
MGDKAFITPSVLKWSRVTAHMTPETAAGKVSVTADKIAEWESGKSQPTIRQAEILARTYHRPLALLFLPEPPMDFQPLQDFRRKTAGPLSTASIFIIREIRQKQAWTREFYEESGEKELPFVGRFSLRDGPGEIAGDILKELAINPGSYRTENPMREWIEKAEAKGIFISRTSYIHSRLKLDSEEMQGFVITDRLAPFVFINSEDWDAPQLFTLVHELAHIWIDQSGISNEILPDNPHRDQLDPIELFCNRVAAEALMPKDQMEKLDNEIFDSADKVYKAAKQYGVSAFALLFRAFDLNRIPLLRYRKLKGDTDKAFRDFVVKEEEKALAKKQKPGGPDHYLIQANRNGHLFTKFIMDAFRGGFIQPTEASSLLNTPVNKFPKLEAFVY